MTDIVGAVAYDVIAEFDDAKFVENVAQGAARARDELGRFVKEHRSVAQKMMSDFGSIMGDGTTSAMSVVAKNMSKAADAAGKGFTSRMSAALKSLPQSMGEALSSGAISIVQSAGTKLGQHVSDALSDQIEKSAPFWKKAFSTAFTQAADVNTTTALAKLSEKIKGGGDNAGKSFQDALLARFSRAGIVASAGLGNFAAQVANKIIPGSTNAGNEGVTALVRPFTDRLPSMLKVGLVGAAGVGLISLISRFRKGGQDAAAAAGDGMQQEATAAGGRGGRGLITGMLSVLQGAGALVAKTLSAAGGAIVSAGAAIGKATASAMGDALKLGANMVGTAVAGILGTSLAKGMGRLTAIDNAEASLRGLASTANHVPEIMEAVNNAVTGTAFGLDQGAKAAAQFAAAGVPLADMERHLGALANTAAAAGGDFDGVAGIFSKVAATGKVTGDVLNQLTERGLAALPALATELGVTAEEAQKMVTEGEVSFDAFSRAMDAAMGNVAIEQAKTFSGLMSNVGSAMGRLGATLQKPFFEATKLALPGVINLFRQLQNAITPVMEIVSQALIPAAEKLGGALSALQFDGLNTNAQQLAGTLGVLAPVLGGVAALFAGPLLSSIPVVGGLFSGLTGPVGILAGALVALFAIKPETMLAGFQTITDALPPMLNTIVAGVHEVMPLMASRLAENAPVLISGFAEILNQLVFTVARLAPMMLPAIVDMVTSMASALLNAVPMLVLTGVQLVEGLVNGVVAALPVLIGAINPMVRTFVSAISDVLPKIIEGGVDIVLGLVDGILGAVPLLVRAIPNVVFALLDGVLSALPQLIQGGIELVNGLIQGIVTAVPLIVQAVVQAIPLITTFLVESVPQLLEAGLALIDGLVTGVIEGLPQIIDAVVTAIPGLITALTEALPKLIQAGIKLTYGLTAGVVRAIPQLVTAIVDALPLVIDALVTALPMLIEAGIQIVLGLINGIIVAIPEVVTAVITAIPQIIGALITALPQLIQGGIQLVIGLIQGVIQAAPQIVSAVVGLIPAILSGLGAAFPGVTKFFQDTWTSITSTITTIWNNVTTFFSDTWRNITLGAQLAWNAFTSWISSMFLNIVNVGMGIWNGLVTFFSGLWQTITAATQFAWNAVTSWLRSIFMGAVNNARNVWNGLTSFFSGLWNGITKTFNTFLGFIKTKPKEAFENAVDSIGRVWKGIQDLAKKPVRFVIETVINGLIGTINKLPGVNIAKVPLPPGFARGGVLPGYGARKKDTMLTPMRAGEGVLVPEVVRGLGPSFVHTLNAVGNSQGVAGVRRAFGEGMALGEGRALGGLITPLPKGSWTQSQPYHAGHNGLDMAAAMGTKILAAADGIVQMAQAVNMGGNEIYIAHKRLSTRYSHLSGFKVRAGTMVKQGQVIGTVGSTGMSTGPHLHYMVHRPGGNPGNYGDHVNPAPYIGAYGQAFDGFDLISGLLGFATSTFRNAFPEGGLWADIAGGLLTSGVEQLTKWGTSFLGEDSDDRGHTHTGGSYSLPKAKIYDNGGWIPNGGMGLNLSGRPEAVLDPEESQGLKAMLRNGGAREIVFEEGAIVVQSGDSAERTTIELLDRIAEELEV